MLKAGPGPLQGAVDRTDGRVKHVAHLVGVVPEHVAQDEHGQLTRGQCLERGHESRENDLSGQFTLSYELKPLSSFGLGKNGGFVLKLPGELEVPFAIGGIPFFLGIKTAFFVTVGFSNKNQSISGSYTIDYNGDAGFSTSAGGVSTGTGAIQGIGKVLLDQANAILKRANQPGHWGRRSLSSSLGSA